MEFNWSILGWIAGLVFVYIFGLMEGRSQGYKKRRAEEEQAKKNQPLASPETVVERGDDPGMLRIRREAGAFTLDLDGARVNPASLSADHRKRLIEILSIVRPWLEGRSAPAPAPARTPSPPPSRPTPVEQPAPRPVPVQPAPTPPAISRPGTIAREDRPVSPVNSIVAQIDSVLQARLEGTALEERGVFLTESPEGGVAVFVGLTRYSGIDEVPDPDIKAAIRAAIVEWEEKFTPGL
jgi:hypothetical protein